MTPAQIEAALRAQFPVGIPVSVDGERVMLTGPAYETRLAEMVAEEVKRQDAEAEATAEDTRREQVKALYVALKAGTATPRQVQTAVAWLLRQQIRELLP